ncbi:arylsulfatase [Roseiarcus fermentans]|uniref:Arylsulfatase n=1 Tax=Roseiarcus fermentans TaxID=1473586 RepID=A0A366FGS2_9HYPH|nr:arylsulfatase [Roseiarcus fermentans]RBP13811.1 arylsulfatase [Roseiarcus fermentans]
MTDSGATRSFLHRGRLGLAILAAALAAVSAAAAQSAGPRPNVALILADNVGWGDLGPYGGGELRGFPTPRIDDLARQGLRLTQYLVEPSCTPSRAALMTGQYSIRNGLSLVLMPGTPNTLPADAFTMGDLFHGLGYATAIFGKWHLGRDPQSLPTAHGFDEFYGIPPDWSWDSATFLDTIRLTHSYTPAHEAAVAAEAMMVEAKAGGPLRAVKPYTPAVRAEIDNELTDRAIDFMTRAHAAGRPFFLYLPFSMGHYPNLPSHAFAGKSRIGNYGDKMMEGDFHVGQILDALERLGVDRDTIVVFASDNGPQGMTVRELGNSGTPDMGFSGPFRGELGDASEGSVRTFAFVRWPGHVAAGSSSNAMVSEMDFLPTFAAIVGGKLPADRPIDGVDQSEALFGRSALGAREQLLTFIGPDLVAARWKQWRVYYRDIRPSGEGAQRLGGLEAASGEMNGYPKLYNIEMDPAEQLNVAFLFPWALDPALQAVKAYERSVKDHPNPPAPNITRFRGGG